MNKIAQNSLVIVDSVPVPLTDDGPDQASSTMGKKARFTPKVGIDKKLRNHLIGNADFARRKAGYADNDVARFHIGSAQTLGPGVSFADALRAFLTQTTTIHDTISGDAEPVETDRPCSDRERSEISHVVRQIKSRASPSMRSYHSNISQLPYNAFGGADRAVDLKRETLSKSQLDPADFCPLQSTLLAKSTPTQAWEDINRGTSPSVIEWLLLNDIGAQTDDQTEDQTEDQESVCICVG